MQLASKQQADAFIRCKRGDIPFLIELARETYPTFDDGAASRWLDKVLPNPDALVLRTGQAAVVALAGSPPWMPHDRQCHILFVLGYPRGVWDVVRLLRASQDWAVERGCSVWRFGADVPFDLEPLARRVGAIQDSPRFIRALSGRA